MQQLKSFLSFFDPTTSKYDRSWGAFDRELTFEQQLITISLTALATFFSLPILCLGGLATFRALVNHFSPLDSNNLPDTPMGNAAKKTEKKSREVFDKMTEEEFVEKALLFFENPEKKNKLEKILRSLYEKYGSPETLLTAFKHGTKKERGEALSCALMLHESFNTAHEFEKLMIFAVAIKNGSRVERFEKLKPFCEGLMKTSDIQYIDRCLNKFSTDEEKEILDAFSFISSQFDLAVDRVKCFEVVKTNITAGQRVSVIRDNQDLLKFVSNSYDLSKVLPNLTQDTLSSKEHILSLADKLCIGDEAGFTLDKIIRCVKGVPSELHEQLLKNVERCLEGINGEDLYPVIQILDSVLRLEASERVDVVGVAMSHIHSKMVPYERRLILSALLDVDAQSRHLIEDAELQKMIKVKKQIIEFIGKISSSANKPEIFAAINQIPENQREILFAQIAPALEKIETAEAFAELIDGAKMIAPQHRASVIESYKGAFDSTFTWKKLVKKAFGTPEILNDSKEYLRVLLENETDESVGRNIAQKIWNNLHVFRVSEQGNDELFTVLMGIVPVEEGHVSNCYRVYGMHLKRDKEVTTPDVLTPAETVGGKRVRMDQKFFEKMVREKKEITYGDLPEKINMETLKGLFSAFENRLDRLSTKEREKAWTVGVSGCMISAAHQNWNPKENDIRDSYQFTKSIFLGSAYIKDMLERTGEPSKQVSMGYLHLFAIIKFIKDSSIEINPETGLSNQEESLLKMLSSIQNCGTGKSEGFAEFYSSLPTYARFYGRAQAEKKADKAKVYLAMVMQSVLAKYLEGFSSMAYELTQRHYDDEQWMHSRKYLKNLIAKRIGLEWDIAFDAYPGCIDENLRNRSLENVLQIFYKHITPKKFLDDVFRVVQNDIVPNMDEIEKVDKNLKAAQKKLDKKLKEGELPELLKEENELSKDSRKLKTELLRANAKVKQLQNSDTNDNNHDSELKHAKQVYDGLKAKETELKKKQRSNDQTLENEKRKLGIPKLEEKVEKIGNKLEELYKDINKEIVGQFVGLFSDSEENGLWSPIDSYGDKSILSPKGVTLALIEAGYFARV